MFWILLKMLWKMEHLLKKSKCSIFHNIVKYMIFQTCQNNGGLIAHFANNTDLGNSLIRVLIVSFQSMLKIVHKSKNRSLVNYVQQTFKEKDTCTGRFIRYSFI